MKKFIKTLFVVVLGILCVACGGTKTQYDLEGKYSLKRIEYNEDGTEILKLNANEEKGKYKHGKEKSNSNDRDGKWKENSGRIISTYSS